jgi:putative flippase GtrA
MGIGGNRFEYELAQLIYAKHNGIKTYEIPIQTVYPTEEEGHRSHFRPITDSARILRVMLTSLGSYAISSVLSAVTDVLLFFLISTLLPNGVWYNTLIATVSARMISSVVNFVFNYRYVFSGKGRRSAVRYYILWLIQLCLSYGFVSLLGNTFGVWGIWLTVFKGAWDLVLALFSYRIQMSWVFAARDPHRFRTFGVRLLIRAARAFSTEYRCNVIRRDEPVLYVARHLDMHGPYTTVKSIPFDFHPMILSVFFDPKSSYRQFADYTLTVREGKSAGGFNFKALIYSIIAPLIVNGVGGIPVYRDNRAVRTVKLATSALLAGDAVTVYADVDYTAPAERESELYSGFLYIGETYYRKSGKSLKIIPLYIDDERHTVSEGDAVYVDSYRRDKDDALARLRAGVNGRRVE